MKTRRALSGLLLILLAGTTMACDQLTANERDALLQTNLHTLRDVIAQHHGDKGRYPERLEELIEAGYLRKIPIDPMTRSAATWVPVYAEDAATGRPGIVDVHAGKPDWLARLRALWAA
jgi:general secretion pathway protein G